ncbi:MAG: hypothetical protein LBQ82_02220 [Treponema sp.]|jgi:hypothetical protein|nr:hypothetical protein [Treponema sp.]
MNKLVVFMLLITAALSAQEFGFGFDDEETSSGTGTSANGNLNVSIGGEVSATMLGYGSDFHKGAESVELGDIFSGKLNFSAKASVVEGVINLKIQTKKDEVVKIDEGYLRAYFGKFDVEAGLRKLTWGKADSMGPLDVINPLDTSQIYTEMADNTSLMGVKIARPLVHASFRFGQFSKIEGVFVPYFEGHYIPSEGRWAPAQMEMLKNPEMSMPIPSSLPIPVNVDVGMTETKPDTTKLNYAQGGLRFTTTIGSVDFGIQYYYGRLPQPAAKISLTSFDLDMPPSFPPSYVNVDAEMDILYKYNPYHQIGLDYAQVLFGLNVRAEVAANITEDLKGDDGSVYNPSIAWSFGFDRNLFLGINLNLQINESIILMHDKLGSKEISMPDDIFNLSNLPNIENIINDSLKKIDTEGGKPLTSTRLTAALSKKFLRDELELRTAVVWGIEDMDCLIMPALIWTKDALRTALSGGIFAGNKEGQLGQYADNNFVKVSLTYSF